MTLTRPLAIFDTEYSSLDREKARLLALGIVILLPDEDEPIRWSEKFNPAPDLIGPCLLYTSPSPRDS